MISKKNNIRFTGSYIIAKRYDSGPVLITDLASEGRIPKKFLEAILSVFRKNDI